MTDFTIEPNDEVPFDVYRRLREETGEDYWPVSTLAQFMGVNTRTLRAQAKAGHIPIPSQRVRHGGLSLQVYNKDEAEKVQDYYLGTGRPLKRILSEGTLGEQKW